MEFSKFSRKVKAFAPAFLLSFALSTSAYAEKVQWSYEGETGPEHWGDLSPEYHLCRDGTQQSGINIEDVTDKSKVGNIKFRYKDTPLRILNNGHTIQVNYERGSTITVNGETFELLQFHFHTPSEHTKNGTAYPLEGHLVHINSNGQLAVVGVFMKEGEHNSFIQAIWDYMPPTEGEITVPLDINAADMLPRKKGYYYYPGSLTTPPCSEGVKWHVMKQPIEISSAQIQQFRSLYPLNARPVQPLNGRVIKSNKVNQSAK